MGRHVGAMSACFARSFPSDLFYFFSVGVAGWAATEDIDGVFGCYGAGVECYYRVSLTTIF